MLKNLAVLFLSCISLSAFAAAESPRAVVDTIIEKASKLDNKATKAENARVIESLVDFETLANNALGDNLEATKPAERKQIQELLRKIITKTVYPEAPKFFRDVKIQYTAEKEEAGKTHVSSVVTKGTKRSTVDYWLAQKGGGYKVVDLAIEGERWVENVSDQFDEVIAKNGVKGLISRMQKRLSQIEPGKK